MDRIDGFSQSKLTLIGANQRMSVLIALLGIRLEIEQIVTHPLLPRQS
jgi:hypothetical protein